ncbi:MAG: hypothetical protein CFE32_04830, partial [Alphaproteobacteria bacterium PA3]
KREAAGSANQVSAWHSSPVDRKFVVTICPVTVPLNNKKKVFYRLGPSLIAWAFLLFDMTSKMHKIVSFQTLITSQFRENLLLGQYDRCT